MNDLVISINIMDHGDKKECVKLTEVRFGQIKLTSAFIGHTNVVCMFIGLANVFHGNQRSKIISKIPVPNKTNLTSIKVDSHCTDV